jgi:F0F1-type ATP synthase membrane subunit c/vacuolar-type H+-ATPase subunit K
VAPRVQTIGTIGAVLLLAGLVVAGAGWVNLGIAQNNANNCLNCPSPERAALNATAETSIFYGVGVTVGGIGAGLVVAVLVQFLARQPARGPSGTPAVTPPTSPPLAPPPGW